MSLVGRSAIFVAVSSLECFVLVYVVSLVEYGEV